MINIELRDIFIAQPVYDEDFYDGKPFNMSIVFSGPLRYIRSDWETDVQIKYVEVRIAEYNGEKLGDYVYKEIAEYIRKNLVYIVTVCTDESIKLDTDGLLEAAYEALNDLGIL